MFVHSSGSTELENTSVQYFTYCVTFTAGDVVKSNAVFDPSLSLLRLVDVGV